MFTLTVEADGLFRKFTTLAGAADDLRKPLKQWGHEKMAEIKAIYAAQEFAPLAQSTIQHRAERGLRTLENKLAYDVRKALKRARIAREKDQAPRGLISRVLASRKTTRIEQDILSSQTRGVQNRTAVLAEFHRQHHKSKEKASFSDRLSLKQLTVKQMSSLDDRTARAVARQTGKPILGGLNRTLKMEVVPGGVKISSLTKYHWSEVHNSGGTGNKGASIPERKTIELTEKNLDRLGEILVEHHLVPAFKGA